jgi:hypothetical protein
MTHLDDLESIDALDDTLVEARGRHLDACAECRAKVDALRATVSRVAGDRVPEPSPLFWDHLSARVREAVRVETPGRARRPLAGWLGAPGVRLAASIALAIVVLAGAARVFTPGRTPAGPSSIDTRAPVASSAPDASGPSLFDAADPDPAWDLVRTVADEVSQDDDLTAALAVRPGWAERAALQLNDAERGELLRLLQQEARRPGA